MEFDLQSIWKRRCGISKALYRIGYPAIELKFWTGMLWLPPNII
ncbi:MAG: hypothetical protein AB4426_06645 [Xenococcaceae cyanobacterium]